MHELVLKNYVCIAKSKCQKWQKEKSNKIKICDIILSSKLRIIFFNCFKKIANFVGSDGKNIINPKRKE